MSVIIFIVSMIIFGNNEIYANWEIEPPKHKLEKDIYSAQMRDDKTLRIYYYEDYRDVLKENSFQKIPKDKINIVMNNYRDSLNSKEQKLFDKNCDNNELINYRT